MDKEDTTTLKINYEKRKNTDLFKLFQKEDLTYMGDIQNYIPIYSRFFQLNETNYNSINLNHKWFLTDIKNSITNDNNLFNCTIQNLFTSKTKKKQLFFKMAPLLDPYKYLVGKYNINDPELFNLPKIKKMDENGIEIVRNIHPKLLDYNNSAYVDGFFSFLSSLLINKFKFVNGVDYYGSFIGIKQNFKLNIIDDLEYMCKSDFFNKNKNINFKVDDYSFLFNDDQGKLEPIKIDYNNSLSLSIKSFDDNLFEDIFSNDTPILENEGDNNANENKHVTLDDLKNNSIEMIDIMVSNTSLNINNNIKITTKSDLTSSCSSRTSHTSENDITDTSSNNNDETNESGSGSGSGSDEYSDDSDEDIVINATIPKFPIQIICMEKCEKTFDDLILNNELSQDEWFSALMQIIMILTTYQKSFSFTHNDLHTNNVMYNITTDKFIYYCFNKIYYKVPTFGRIFKIIDFGRAIYKFNGNVFCSDSFQPGNDASTQYNTEPYFNDKKHRLEPNYSFDLCRLACSIFDYVIDDLDDVLDFDNCEPIVKIIYDWCLDDNGINILYKTNGVERYPDFKLYKMIARCVHNHTPQAQLERDDFKKFIISKKNISTDQVIVDIDIIPSFSSTL